MSETNRTIEERRSTITCPRPGWLTIDTPTEQRDRPNLNLTFRAKNVKSYGLSYSYTHPDTLGVIIYVDDGNYCVENLPLEEFDAAMIKAESCNT